MKTLKQQLQEAQTYIPNKIEIINIVKEWLTQKQQDLDLQLGQMTGETAFKLLLEELNQ